MPNNYYLPTKASDLQAWTQNFLAVANANLAPLGLIAGDVTPVSTDKTSFDIAIINDHTTSGNEQISYNCEIQLENLQVPVNTFQRLIYSKQITIKSTSKVIKGSKFHAYIAPVCQP
ncbi:MAG: hypothetical protein WCR42_06765 [bacterium]